MKLGADVLRTTDIIFMNMTMKDKPKPRVYLYTEVTVQESGH